MMNIDDTRMNGKKHFFVTNSMKEVPSGCTKIYLQGEGFQNKLL